MLFRHQKQIQLQLAAEAGDGIPAALDGKARKVLGIPTPPSSPPGRTGGVPLPKRKPVRPVQASPSPLPLKRQQQQQHLPGDGRPAAESRGETTGGDPLLVTPVGGHPAPFAEGSVPKIPEGPSDSGTQPPAGGSDNGEAAAAERGAHGGDGHPPRDRAAARAARLEADKLAALRSAVAEVKREAAIGAGAAGLGDIASWGGGGGPLEIPREGSKAWKVLGASPGLVGAGGDRGSELPSALVATSKSLEVNVQGAKAGLEGTAEGSGRGDGERPLSLSLANVDIGAAGAAVQVAQQWAATTNTVPTPHGGTTRRADPPLSPGEQTPPPLSPSEAAPDEEPRRPSLTVAVPADSTKPRQQQRRGFRLHTPLSARGSRSPLWGTAAEAEEAAATVSPPSWAQASPPSGSNGGGGMRRGFMSSPHSAASTPRGTRSSSFWGGGGGGGAGDRTSAPMMTRTPGRIPRRINQGVNRVKRAVAGG